MRHQPQTMPEIITDYELKIYYNPYFHELRMAELKADKEDLYYKSCSWTVYDEQEGIHRQSIRVETLAEKILALDELISAHERQYERHRRLLLETVKDWHSRDIAVLDRYFKRQLTGGRIESDLIDHLKRTLYPLEQQARDDRERNRGIDRNAWIKEALEEWKASRGGEAYDEADTEKVRYPNRVHGRVQRDIEL